MDAVQNDKTETSTETINKTDEDETNHKQNVIRDTSRPVVNTAQVVGEPDFDALAVVENVFSDRAAPPPLLSDEQPGEQSEVTRRGRPALSDDERAERKKERDARYRESKKNGAVSRPTASATVAPKGASPKVAAGMIVGIIEMSLVTISGGEFAADKEVKKGTIDAWERYLAETGGEIPAWAEVALMSAVFVAPAMTSPTLVERFGIAWHRAKTFVMKRIK